MLVPRSWLAEYCALDQLHPALTNTQLADAFNELGLIVEGFEEKGEGLNGIVTAQVRTIRAHPNADKIRLVDVVTSDAATETLQIACGAWNFKEGDKVPLATLGTTMPDGMSIERRKMRGEWSNGMLCSTRELKLGDDHAGILVLDPDTPLGVPIAQALGITADAVFDLGIEANRPDAMSVVGIARDLAAKLNVPFTMPNPAAGVAEAPAASVKRGSIMATDLCDRLTVTIIRNVTVTESPEWMKSRLAHAGMRAINNLVDASNYVMLELGAPSHAFDLDKLPGGAIGVRWAGTGEVIQTLDGVSRTLSRAADGAAVQDGVITDGLDRAVGIAAIMGGASSEVDDSTKNLLLEVAHWTPMCIARSSKRLGLRSEASARFERGTDPEGLVRAAGRFVELVRGTCPELTIESFDDIRPVAAVEKKVRVRTERVNLLLGTAIGDATIASLIGPIGFICTPTNEPGVQEVTIPSWRTDASDEVDVVEEIGRHFGYQNIERRTLRTDLVGKLTPYQQQRRRVTLLLADLGLDEVWTATLMNPADLGRSRLKSEAVTVSNPLDKAESVMRPSLLPGLLRALSYNANHRNPALRLFEIGHVFQPPRPEQIVPYEREHLAAVFAADSDDARTATSILDRLTDLLRVKPAALRLDAWADGPGLHPTRTARIIGSGTGFPIGSVGEVDPVVLAEWGIERRVGWLQVDLENLCGLPKRSIGIDSFSRFPSSDFDLAFVAPESVVAARVEAAIRSGAGDLLESVSLFDVYRGDRVGGGSRSLAYAIRICASDRTLTDAEVAATRQSCIDAVSEATGAQLRS
jgi:phenylalanyl-tRNA synthetase beta chain